MFLDIMSIIPFEKDSMETLNNREDISFRKPRLEKRQKSFEFITIPIIIVMLLVSIIGNITRLVTHCTF